MLKLSADAKGTTDWPKCERAEVVAVLEVQGLAKRFGSTLALAGCTFTATPKRLTGLLGPNGAGKTTIMRSLLGLVVPDRGTVSWQGAAITERTWHRFGYMPEERGLYPTMTVGEQISYFARLSGLSRAAAEQRTGAVIHQVGLDELASRRVEQLSHGNQQRVQLAVALVHEPELLILDEPFAGLDPLGVSALGDLLLAAADDGATVLFSSHQLDLVQHLCQDIVTIDHGRVVLAGSLERLQAEAPSRHVDVVFSQPPARDWCAGLCGARVSGGDDRHVRVAVSGSSDPAAVLRAAQAAGPLLSFSFQPPSLEEMFLEAIGQ
jgi:ABC-2 type transport system ATP-binding protein